MNKAMEKSSYNNGRSNNTIIDTTSEIRAKKEKIEAFNIIMNSVKTDLPKIEGCRAVTVYRSSTDESKFTLVETWESKEQHQAHLNKLTTDGTWDMIASQLSHEPESDYFFEI